MGSIKVRDGNGIKGSGNNAPKGGVFLFNLKKLFAKIVNDVLQIKDSMTWDGVITFGVVAEMTIEELMEHYKNGTVPWKRKLVKHNKVTNYARAYMVQMLTGTAVPIVLPSKMELGTGSGTPAATDTDLWAPAVATLKPLSVLQVYLTYYVQFVCTWNTADPVQGTWTEVGLKDANGNLWAHGAMSAFTVNAGEMLVGQWAVQILGN